MHPRCQERPWGPLTPHLGYSGSLALPARVPPLPDRQAGHFRPQGPVDGADGLPGSRVKQAGGAQGRRMGVRPSSHWAPSKEADAHLASQGFTAGKQEVLWDAVRPRLGRLVGQERPVSARPGRSQCPGASTRPCGVAPGPRGP